MNNKKAILGYLTTGSHTGESKTIKAKLFANSYGPELYYIISYNTPRKPHIIKKGDIFTINDPHSKNNGDVIHFITPYHVEYSDKLGEVFGSHIIANKTQAALEDHLAKLYQKRIEQIIEIMHKRHHRLKKDTE